MKPAIVFTDIDGVWTDGGIYVADDGTLSRRFNTLDSHGVLLCHVLGIPLVVISGDQSEATSLRLRKLGVTAIRQAVADKLSVARKECVARGLSLEDAAYIGDALNDLPLLRAVGHSATVPNAPPYVRESVRYVTQRAGGHGAFADFIEFLLAAENLLGVAQERCFDYWAALHRQQ
jgi:YrbI family 3-deoxy-D-manno-octulosonate 8-phosphate phosphatase